MLIYGIVKILDLGDLMKVKQKYTLHPHCPHVVMEIDFYWRVISEQVHSFGFVVVPK